MTVERDLTEHAKLLEESAAIASSINDGHPSLRSLLEQFLQASLRNPNMNDQFHLFKLKGGMQFLVGVQFIGQVPHVWYGDLAQRGARDWIKDTIQTSFAQNHVDATRQQNFHDLFADILMRKVEATQMDLGAGIIPVVNNSPLEDTLQSMQTKMREFVLAQKAMPVANTVKVESPAVGKFSFFSRFRGKKERDQQQQSHSSKPGPKSGSGNS
jgi:hypothetical protein